MTVQDLLDRLNAIPEKDRNATLVTLSGRKTYKDVSAVWFEFDTLIIPMGGFACSQRVCEINIE